MNIALLESVAYFFSLKDNNFLANNREIIKDNFQKLLDNQEYLDAIKLATSGKTKVINRFKLAQQILGDVEGCSLK